jgi:hypothetical protein
MHHFIYPSKDTYISNRSGYDTKNFGIDEILQIGTSNALVRSVAPTKTYSYSNSTFSDYPVQNFSGTLTGSVKGNVSELTGTISGSDLVFSVEYFSGSINSGSIAEQSGSISGSAIGIMSGSFISVGFIGIFAGQLTGSTGCIDGVGSGTDTRNEQHWITTNTQYIDRSLLKFNIDAISASVASGNILNPRFHLKLKVCNEYELPIAYSVYALPVSQSWNMGNGYFSDGGSTNGASWKYKNLNSGDIWYNTYTSSARPTIDFITDINTATGSFEYGGGTWYTGSNHASQSFDYETADINMDVTDIVMEWISGSIPNEGFLLVSSDELQATGSGFTMKFFSQDTNTIYSPYLDVMWLGNSTISGGGGGGSSEFVTGSYYTSSVVISYQESGMDVTVQSGSTFTSGGGGISGTFSGSTLLLTATHKITASNASLIGTFQQFTASVVGTINGYAEYASGSISGSGWFTSSYFSGSIDGISSILSNTGISSSLVSGSIDGYLSTTGSISIFSGEITASSFTVDGIGSGNYLDEEYAWIGGIVNGTGLTPNILGLNILGNYEGIMSSQVLVEGSCGNSFSASLVTASLTSGVFSSSVFTAYYVDHKFENAHLTGSWTEAALLGSQITIPIPSGIDPYAYAYVNGIYIYGKALGTYTIADPASSSFTGQFIEGPHIGGNLSVQLSGSVYSSSYYYTSSVSYETVGLNALNTTRPFTVIVQNLHPTYKAGDIAKIGVFGRDKFPTKGFERTTQQQQYLVPEYLPTSSYYALKDNETGEIVIDFDSYTQISSEYPAGNYFVIDTTGLPQERYYRVLIRVADVSGSSYTIDGGKIFKITR